MRGTFLRGLTLLVSGAVACLSFPSEAAAHRLDEYLQATLATIDPGEVRLQVNLTPGVEVAERVLSRIDRDRDGKISAGEAAAYAELLKSDLVVRLDTKELTLKLSGSDFPPLDDLRTGLGVIQLEFSAKPQEFAAGPHSLTVENRHLPALSVYLFNAAMPKSPAIQITGQKRNTNQSSGEIAFTAQLSVQSER